jgi:hypothetical protein
MGGTDIFKTQVVGDKVTEVTNAGYPINSSADDFAFVLDRSGQHGYLSSNRRFKDKNDDIYEVEMDLQTYPLMINGVLSAKESGVSNNDKLELMAEVNMFLVDHTREIVVMETKTDKDGKFTLTIPYFSQYKIKVVERNGEETIVSLDIPKQKKDDYNHSIVVVRDALKLKQ